jgi:hypothetical protein
MAGLVPIGVNVTFKTHGKEGERTYFYNGVQVAQAILNGDDPSAYAGVQVDGSGSGSASGFGQAFGEMADIGELI